MNTEERVHRSNTPITQRSMDMDWETQMWDLKDGRLECKANGKVLQAAEYGQGGTRLELQRKNDKESQKFIFEVIE